MKIPQHCTLHMLSNTSIHSQPLISLLKLVFMRCFQFKNLFLADKRQRNSFKFTGLCPSFTLNWKFAVFSASFKDNWVAGYFRICDVCVCVCVSPVRVISLRFDGSVLFSKQGSQAFYKEFVSLHINSFQRPGRLLYCKHMQTSIQPWHFSSRENIRIEMDMFFSFFLQSYVFSYKWRRMFCTSRSLECRIIL